MTQSIQETKTSHTELNTLRKLEIWGWSRQPFLSKLQDFTWKLARNSSFKYSLGDFLPNIFKFSFRKIAVRYFFHSLAGDFARSILLSLSNVNVDLLRYCGMHLRICSLYIFFCYWKEISCSWKLLIFGNKPSNSKIYSSQCDCDQIDNLTSKSSNALPSLHRTLWGKKNHLFVCTFKEINCIWKT